MKLKIFKTAIYTLIIMLSMHSYANSQGMPTAKEKQIELKMQKMEQKLQDMQVKLDSMKIYQKKTITIDGLDINKEVERAMKAVPQPNVPPAPLTHSIGEGIDQAFKSINKAMNFNFNFDFSDKKLEERIKSGDVKQIVKNYSKSYSVDKHDKLQINNSYGKVTINTWKKNEFKVDVEIKATANTDDEAQKILDGVTIEDKKDGSTVWFKTNIERKNGGNSWGNWTDGAKNYIHKVEVNYVIYMPSQNSLDVTNKYGGTIIPDFDGKLVAKTSYGSFTGKTLTNPANEITTQYGSTNIVNLKGGDVKVSYGSLTLGSSDNLNADISYGSAKIDKIKTAGNITVKYSGGLRIGDLDKNFKNLSINSSYSSVAIGMDGDPNCDFDVSVHYGSFNYGDHNVNITSKTPGDNERGWNPTKTYKGHIGKGNSDKVLTIKSTYGSVKLTDKPSSL